MTVRTQSVWIAWVIVLTIGFFGCGGQKEAIPTKGRPGWIDKGSGFFTGDRGRAFYGVGAASNISTPSLRRNTADAQARADLARTFKSRIEDLVKVYTASTVGGVVPRESPEQFASTVTKAFTAMDLSGAMIIDRYYDEKEKTQYSLVMLDASAFKDQIMQMKELSQQAQEAIRANAEGAFEELEQEVEKEKGR